MNLKMELEEVIMVTIGAYTGDPDDPMGAEVYRAVDDWLNRNQIVLYQP